MKKPIVLWISALSLAGLTACQGKPAATTGPAGSQSAVNTSAALSDAEKAMVVAKVNDTVITLEEFQRRLESIPPYARARYNTFEHRKEFLIHHLIGFSERTPFRMSDNTIDRAAFRNHCRRYLSGVRSFFFPETILSPE